MVAAKPTTTKAVKEQTAVVSTSSSSAATETAATASVMSRKAIQLTCYLRGHKSVFRPGTGFQSSTKALFLKNDTGRTFCPPDQIQTNIDELPGHSVALYMHDNADMLVADALAHIAQQLHIHDKVADVLTYDLYSAFRAVSYAAAVQSIDFLDSNNVGMMRELHDEIGIPGSSLKGAIDNIKNIVVAHLKQSNNTNNNINADLVHTTSLCFDCLRDGLC